MNTRATFDLEFFQQEDGPCIIALGRNFGQPIFLNPFGIARNRYVECIRTGITGIGRDSSGRNHRYTVFFQDQTQQLKGELERDSSTLLWGNLVFNRIRAPARINIVPISELQKPTSQTFSQSP